MLEPVSALVVPALEDGRRSQKAGLLTPGVSFPIAIL